MKMYDQIALNIIKEQETLIGPVAWYQAEKVKGLRVVDQKSGNLSIDDSLDNKLVIDSLVEKFIILFGKAARQVCKDSVVSLIADLEQSEIPNSLR